VGLSCSLDSLDLQLDPLLRGAQTGIYDGNFCLQMIAIGGNMRNN